MSSNRVSGRCSKKPVSAGRRQQRRRETGSPRSLVRDAAIDRFD
jgi:hypothetical protein